MKPLYPIMAVVVIASAGALPLRARAADGENHPVNVLVKLMTEKPAAREDAGKRFEAYLAEAKGPGGGSFVGGSADLKAIGAVAREWGASQAPIGDVAHLYFIIGPGDKQPDWAASDDVLKKSFVPGPRQWEGRLRAAMSKYEKTPIAKAQEKSQTTAFLHEAAAAAVAIINDPRTKAELDADIAKRDEPVVVPDTRNGARGRGSLDGGTRQYTLDDLYREGAVFGDVAGPKDANSRKISIKIYSTRKDDGSIVNEIGIFDITDTNDIFGQRFPLDQKTKAFVLDDRTPGHKKYELTFGEADANGNRSIKFARPDGGPALETSVGELLMKRADQAERMGNIVNVGGQDFYALPQGGAKSAMALFPKSLIDNRMGTKDARDLAPQLYAEVGERGPDGRNVNVKNPANSKGGPHLGTVNGKDYHVEWDPAAKAWVVKEGAGDLPEKPKPPTTGTGTGTGDPNNPGGGGTNPTTPGGNVSIADLTALLLKDPNCKQNPDDTKDLDPSLKTSFGLVTCTSDVEGTRQIVLVPASVAPSQQLAYGNTTSNGQSFKLLRARFFGKYLVLVFDKQIQYLDLTKMDNGSFAMAGFVADKNASKFGDVTIFVDALRNYMGISGGKDAEAFTAVPARLKSEIGGKAYLLTGAFSNGDLIVTVTSGGETFSIWPKITKPGQTDSKPDPYANINGPGTAMDVTQGLISSENAKFYDPTEWPESQKLKVIKETAEVGFYEMEGASPKRYFLAFRFKTIDNPGAAEADRKVVTMRQKPFEVFNSTNPLPGGYQLQGVLNGPVVQNRMKAAYRFVSGSSASKGAIVVVQNAQLDAGQSNSKANCVGPVVYWGTDLEGAQTACENSKY